MNAYRPPICSDDPFADLEAACILVEPYPPPPEWNISPSPFDWQVMTYGGDNPRTGFKQPPLEFQFFGRLYSRRQIEQRAADMCEAQHRTSFIIREPTDARFRKAADNAVRDLIDPIVKGVGR